MANANQIVFVHKHVHFRLIWLIFYLLFVIDLINLFKMCFFPKTSGTIHDNLDGMLLNYELQTNCIESH